jgi:hypothetical protein
LVYRISQFRIVLLPFALGLSACQTIDEAPTSSSWSAAPLVRTSEGQGRPDRSSSAPLLANNRGGQSTVIEGSGRFVGEPPTGRSIGHLKTSPMVSRLTSSMYRRRRRPRPSSAIFSPSNILSIPASRARSRSRPPSLFRNRPLSICFKPRCDPTTRPLSIRKACIGSSPPIRPWLALVSRSTELQ